MCGTQGLLTKCPCQLVGINYGSCANGQHARHTVQVLWVLRNESTGQKAEVEKREFNEGSSEVRGLCRVPFWG